MKTYVIICSYVYTCSMHIYITHPERNINPSASAAACFVPPGRGGTFQEAPNSKSWESQMASKIWLNRGKKTHYNSWIGPNPWSTIGRIKPYCSQLSWHFSGSCRGSGAPLGYGYGVFATHLDASVYIDMQCNADVCSLVSWDRFGVDSVWNKFKYDLSTFSANSVDL